MDVSAQVAVTVGEDVAVDVGCTDTVELGCGEAVDVGLLVDSGEGVVVGGAVQLGVGVAVGVAVTVALGTGLQVADAEGVTVARVSRSGPNETCMLPTSRRSMGAASGKPSSRSSLLSPLTSAIATDIPRLPELGSGPSATSGTALRSKLTSPLEGNGPRKP